MSERSFPSTVEARIGPDGTANFKDTWNIFMQGSFDGTYRSKLCAHIDYDVVDAPHERRAGQALAV